MKQNGEKYFVQVNGNENQPSFGFVLDHHTWNFDLSKVRIFNLHHHSHNFPTIIVTRQVMTSDTLQFGTTLSIIIIYNL